MFETNWHILLLKKKCWPSISLEVFFWQEEAAYGESFLSICYISDQLLVLRASGVHSRWWYHLSFDPATHLTWILLYLSLVCHQSSLSVINISSKQNSSKTCQNQVILNKVYVTLMRDIHYKISDLKCLSYPTNQTNGFKDLHKDVWNYQIRFLSMWNTNHITIV